VNSQRLVWLLAAAAAVIGLALWVASARNDAASPEQERVFPTLRDALQDVSEIRLTKGDGSAVTLQKQSTAWQLVERAYPADTGRIRKLLLDLAELEIREWKTSDSANYSKLGVEDATTPAASSTLVEVVTPKQRYSVLIGKQSTPRSGFVRVSGQAASALVEPLITVDVDPKGWLDREVLNVPAKQVQSVKITADDGGAYTLTRTKPEDANLTLVDLPRDAQLASPAAANSAADALLALTFDDVRKAASTVDSKLKAEYRLADGKTFVVTGLREDARTFITVAGDAPQAARLAGWQYQIPAWKFEQIFRPRSALLAQ
jgi:hypothetical protein